MRQFVVVLLAFVAVAGCSGSVDRSPGDVVTVKGTDVFVVDRGAVSDEGRPALLFLHGASFTAEVWVETGILDATAAGGFRSVAVDLPGYGETASIEGAQGDFLEALIAEVDSGNGVIVVSPSMSGRWSLDLIASNGSAAMRGFVPVAPVGIADFVDALAAPVDGLATLVVWGVDDDVVPFDSADDLAAVLTNSSVQTIDDAGHAAYQHQPEAFTSLLIDFALTV